MPDKGTHIGTAGVTIPASPQKCREELLCAFVYGAQGRMRTELLADLNKIDVKEGFDASLVSPGIAAAGRIGWEGLLVLVWETAKASVRHGHRKVMLPVGFDESVGEGGSYVAKLDDGSTLAIDVPDDYIPNGKLYAELFSAVEEMGMWLSFPFAEKFGAVNMLAVLSEKDAVKALSVAGMSGALEALESDVPFDDVAAGGRHR